MINEAFISSISSNSTCEEVANFFAKQFGISEESRNNLIKESISGEILLDIPNKDFKLFGIKGSPFVNIVNYIKENKDKLKGKEINENLSLISDEKKIELFMKNYINYEGNLTNLNLSNFLELNEETMKNYGLNYGQRKKLIKYINYFNILKKEKSEEEMSITISIESSKEEIDEFLKNTLKFSQNIINELEFEASTLFSLGEDLIDDLSDNMTTEEKENLKKFIIQKEKMKNIKTNKIKICTETPKEDIILFLKEKGQDVQDINKIDLEKISGLSLEEKDNLKKLIDNEKQKLLGKENIKIQNELKDLNNSQEKNIEKIFFSKLGSATYPIEIKYKYNVFFILGIFDNSLNNFCL